MNGTKMISLQEKKFSVYRSIFVLALVILNLGIQVMLIYQNLANPSEEKSLLSFYLFVPNVIILFFILRRFGKYLIKQDQETLKVFVSIGRLERNIKLIPIASLTSVEIIQQPDRFYGIILMLNEGRKFLLDKFPTKDKAEAKHAEIQKLLDSK